MTCSLVCGYDKQTVNIKYCRKKLVVFPEFAYFGDVQLHSFIK